MSEKNLVKEEKRKKNETHGIEGTYPKEREIALAKRQKSWTSIFFFFRLLTKKFFFYYLVWIFFPIFSQEKKMKKKRHFCFHRMEIETKNSNNNLQAVWSCLLSEIIFVFFVSDKKISFCCFYHCLKFQVVR